VKSTVRLKKKNKPPKRKRRGLLSRLVRAVFKLGVLALLAAATWSAFFIGTRCYSRRSTDPSATEASTFLTLPEWYIVYNTEEYATFTAGAAPSHFPYGGSITQYWRYYGAACDATAGRYPFSGGNHLMLAVIGSSFSIEYALKGLYENTAGRLSDMLSGHNTAEDALAHSTAVEYGAFMHTVPWYDFPFGAKLSQLWRATPMRGPQMFRKWERRFALTTEYGVKAVYGWLIGLGTHAAYDAVQPTLQAHVQRADGTAATVTLPRYEAFTAAALGLVHGGARFSDIAGNDEILLTAIVPAGFEAGALNTILTERLLTDPTRVRIAVRTQVSQLHDVVASVERNGGRIEHLYDY
jgi:hypothetical protein